MRLFLPETSLPVDEIAISHGPLVLVPDHPRRWLDLLDELAGTRIAWGSAVDHHTVDGWPMRLVEADGATLGVFYTFMEHGAAAIVRAASRPLLEKHGKLVLESLARGRPDWRDMPACIADAWDLEA